MYDYIFSLQHLASPGHLDWLSLDHSEQAKNISTSLRGNVSKYIRFSVLQD